MIEILKIIITILGTAIVQGPEQDVNMVRFDGEAQSAYFVGKTLPGGVDTQTDNHDERTLSARYILEGKDFDGNPCRIFIENSGKADESYTHPRITTDSKALAALNEAGLLGRIENTEGQLTIHIYKQMSQVPETVRKPAAKQGRIEQFNYTAKVGGKTLQKRAQVYLPYGYDAKDKTTRYNVLYLMHGGGDNTTSFLTPPHDWLRLLDVLDHLIAEGKMDPILVVCPTFYPDDQNIGANHMGDAIACTRNFHQELRRYLIPAVERAYNTHFTGKGKRPVEDTRQHRAFGGFSMGALCTWYQMAYDVAAASRFLPLSGDLWVFNSKNEREPTEAAAQWLNARLAATPYAHDFRVFAYSGTKDIAYKPEAALAEALYKDSCPLFNAKNMEFGVKEGGEHFYGHINEYLYHALPLLWDKQPKQPSAQPKGTGKTAHYLFPSDYMADPAAHVFDGKIYIYPSHDWESGIPENDNGDHFNMRDYHVFRLDDPDNGEATDLGLLFSTDDIPWAGRQLWDNDVVEKDGKYYLIFSMKDKSDVFHLGMAVADSPAGPFQIQPDPIRGSYSIDPCLFKDDDGQIYCYFGGIWGGQLQRYDRNGKHLENAHLPEGAEKAIPSRVARMTDDVLQFAEEAKPILIVDENGEELAADNPHRFFEASWMHKYSGKYYYSYSTGDTHYLCYAVGDNPYGPFTYRGVLLNPVVGWTTHHSIVEYQGKWYLFHHDSQPSGGLTWLRSMKVVEIEYDTDGNILGPDALPQQ